MKKEPDVQLSFWRDSVELPQFKKLGQNIDTEVVVVGAGIVGIMNAYQLALEGYDVTLIEGDEILSGTTQNTTARITAQQGLLYGQLSKQMDEEKARSYYDSQMKTIDEIERLVDKHEIDCDFKRLNSDVYTVNEDTNKDLEKEAEVYRTLGIDGHLSKGEPKLPNETTSDLLMKNQAEFHPLIFLKAILGIATDSGVKVFEHTRAKSVEDDTLYTTDGNSINFNHMVIATHFPFLDMEGFYFN